MFPDTFVAGAAHLNRYKLTKMTRIILSLLTTLVLCSCYQTENGLVVGLPEYEERNLEVTRADLEILLKADALLKDETVWSKDSARVCPDTAKKNLLCALEQASLEVNGKYIHRQPALQEVRFVIDDNYKNRWTVHRLEDFNSHPDTSFGDVKTVLAKAIESVRGRLRRTSQ